MPVYKLELDGRLGLCLPLNLATSTGVGFAPIIKPRSRDYAKSLVKYASLFWRWMTAG